MLIFPYKISSVVLRLLSYLNEFFVLVKLVKKSFSSVGGKVATIWKIEPSDILVEIWIKFGFILKNTVRMYIIIKTLRIVKYRFIGG